LRRVLPRLMFGLAAAIVTVPIHAEDSTLACQVVDKESQRPLGHALLRWTRVYDSTGWQQIETDDYGNFSLELPADAAIYVSLIDPLFVFPEIAEYVPVSDAPAEGPLVLESVRGGELRIDFTNDDLSGYLPGSARISLQAFDAESGKFERIPVVPFVGDTGEYIFGPLPAGAYRPVSGPRDQVMLDTGDLQAESKWRQCAVKPKETTRCAIPWEPARVVRVVAQRLQGGKAPLATLDFYELDKKIFSVESDSEGAFEFEVSDSRRIGDVIIEVPDQVRRVSLAYVLSLQDKRSKKLKMRHKGSLEVKILGEDGEPVEYDPERMRLFANPVNNKKKELPERKWLAEEFHRLPADPYAVRLHRLVDGEWKFSDMQRCLVRPQKPTRVTLKLEANAAETGAAP